MDRQSERGDRPALDGLLVVDLSRVLAGPYAAMLLGDLGARIIKIERPGDGDDTRRWGPPFVGKEGAQESTYFLSTNSNKESVILDLKSNGDLAILEGLIRKADVLIENFRAGVLDNLGLSAARLEKLNSRLVTLSITGFGSTGPERARPGYDQILQAEGGLMSFTGSDRYQPTRVGAPIADLVAGMFGAIGILAALRDRGISGRGQRVSTSLLAGQIAIHGFQGTRWLVAGEIPTPSGNHHPTVAPYGLFQTADRPVVIAVGNEEIWRRFAPLVGLADNDAHFRSNSARVANRVELESLISEALRTRRADFWLCALNAAGVPAGEVKSLDRVYASEQVISQGLIRDVIHSSLGALQLPGTPLRFSRSAERKHQAPPTLGEHTNAIRAEFGPEAARQGPQPASPAQEVVVDAASATPGV